ncbi:hypothetical protein J5N97_022082 [Dioscorea zingiberensis]|uniref:Uncharacterized protein n=1 Tax=Dioscorea zingiberensis TaxID=325984 RepID=A0A9D5CB83_9LILI|nr:hypothetical protein J5N97_022082 [Dioscorea zingiberensis]
MLLNRVEVVKDLVGRFKNLVEDSRLPDAPEMEIYCYYGVGIPTERSYVYKLSQPSKCNSIPSQIHSSADGNERDCLRGGVYFVDGDESVPSLSAGFMCAKGWREKPGSILLVCLLMCQNIGADRLLIFLEAEEKRAVRMLTS